MRATLSLSSGRTSLLLALAFGGLALFLSAIGIYGVIADLAAQRRREIAIRMALGSTPAGVVRLVLGQGLVIVALGLAAGFAGAAGLQRVIASQIYGVRPLDPLVIGCVTIVSGTIALAACALPTRRASRRCRRENHAHNFGEDTGAESATPFGPRYKKAASGCRFRK